MKDIAALAGSSSIPGSSAPGRPPASGLGLGRVGLLSGVHSRLQAPPPHTGAGALPCIPAMDSNAVRVRGPTFLSSSIHLWNLLFMSF